VRVCLMIEGQEGVTWDDWVRLARLAETHGLEGLFRSDHYTAIIRADADALDAWATLAGLAAISERIRLGTLVSPATFRPPGPGGLRPPRGRRAAPRARRPLPRLVQGPPPPLVLGGSVKPRFAALA